MKKDRKMPSKDFVEAEHRPWGYYEVLADEDDHKVKRIIVYPGKRLSLQRHRHRMEHWFILRGAAVVTINLEEMHLNAGQSVDIPRGAAHRIENAGTENLAFMEVQTGSYFGEDDIERLQDDYGRI
jgi:mannose-6-phosphate isomerase-like protein (cupin superfamily)